MSSIFVIPADPTPPYIIVAISIILILLFIFYLVYLFSITPRKSPTNVEVACAPGQCITNIYTGEKTCPSSDNITFFVNPTREVCNSKYTCESSTTPFAVQSDGSTNADGICEPNVVCRCLQKPQCANYILTFFEATGGNPFQGVTGTGTRFTQQYSYTDLAGFYQNEPPFSYDNPALQYCTIQSDWAIGNPSRIWPSECAIGTLAYVPSNPSNFEIDETLMGCVIGDTSFCDTGWPGNNGTGTEIAFWDNRVISLCCKNVNDGTVRCQNS